MILPLADTRWRHTTWYPRVLHGASNPILYHNSYKTPMKYFTLCTAQAIEDGNLDEIEEIKKEKKRRYKRKRPVGSVEDEEEPDPEAPEVEKPKKRRGRPPVEKPTPNPPHLTKMMKKLVEVMAHYRDK